ncbi:unnamed protein product, partial [Ectocarpus sp. 12 AP-2014]
PSSSPSPPLPPPRGVSLIETPPPPSPTPGGGGGGSGVPAGDPPCNKPVKNMEGVSSSPPNPPPGVRAVGIGVSPGVAKNLAAAPPPAAAAPTPPPPTAAPLPPAGAPGTAKPVYRYPGVGGYCSTAETASEASCSTCSKPGTGPGPTAEGKNVPRRAPSPRRCPMASFPASAVTATPALTPAEAA